MKPAANIALAQYGWAEGQSAADCLVAVSPGSS